VVDERLAAAEAGLLADDTRAFDPLALLRRQVDNRVEVRLAGQLGSNLELRPAAERSGNGSWWSGGCLE